MRKFDTRLVTIGRHSYNLYNYEDKVSDIENAKVLISWEDGFDSTKRPFCLLCTDCSLDIVTILNYYEVRGNIETGYLFSRNYWVLTNTNCIYVKALNTSGTHSSM